MSQERDPFWPLPHVWGSFDDRESAQRYVTETLRANLDVLQALVKKPAKKAVLIQKTFDEVTGREAFRPHLGAQPEIRETKGVTTVLVRTDESDYGYHVVTSYPSTPPAPNQRMTSSGLYRQGQIAADAYDVSALILNGFHDYYQSGEDWLADFARFAAIGRNLKDLRGCFAALASKDYSADELAFIWVADFAFDFLLPKFVLHDAFGIMRDNVGLKPMVGPKQYNHLQKIAGGWRSWRR